MNEARETAGPLGATTVKRTTIDFGIDLGTTNSTIAVIDGTDAKVIPNKYGSGITPSAVWIDKRGGLHVGSEAKQRALIDDHQNADLEFKLRMGLGDEGRKEFVRSGRALLPEELSAEVLKSLKTDVQTSLGEALAAAVITVPAAFELPQTDATQRAAQIAGFARSPLLLEPVAASLAYGFQTQSDNVYWLVYDFGGGTFDAAVMRVRDGLIQVVNHDGDNHLGGKLLDWDIVVKKLIPVATASFDLPDFRRGNPRWSGAVGRLKYHAELAKIEVCRTRQPHEIWIENLCDDASGKPIDFACTLTPADVEEVTRPYVERSLGLCRKTLEARGLAGADMDRILMVGGTTLNPWVREAVLAALGSRLEFSMDPVTIVARGAAIFASTQRLPASAAGDTVRASGGTYAIDIDHEPVGNVHDPDIGGRVHAPADASLQGCTIEFVEARTLWRSGRITLGGDGVFMTQLFAEDRRRCEFQVELCDATGTRLPVVPDRVVYTLGVVPDSPPASNTIGVGLANDEVAVFIAKGTRLPARGMQDRRTTVPLQAGNAADVLRIPILEGEHPRATRCHPIGFLLIPGTKVRRDLPVGSQIEITIKMDESQRLIVAAYVPVLDEDFEVDFPLRMQTKSLLELREEAQQQKERLGSVRERAQRTDAAAAARLLARIDDEQLIDEVAMLLDAAADDADALSQLDRRLRDLAAAIDAVEDAVEWPVLLERAEESRRDAERIANDLGDAADKSRAAALQVELTRAIESGDPDLVRQCADELDGLWYRIANRHTPFHVGRFNRLADMQASMRDPAQAEQLVAQGRRAIANDDVDALKAANRQLMSLLPQTEQAQVDQRRGTVI